MADAAQLGAQDVEVSGDGWGQPEIGDDARHHVHPGSELRYIEIVQHVLGAQHHLDRAPDRQVQLVGLNEDVVAAIGIARVDPERVVRRDMGDFCGAEHAVGARIAKGPLPLLPGRLDDRGVVGNGYKFMPGKQAGREHAGDADRGPESQTLFEASILRLVVRAIARPVPVSPDRHGHEQVERDECDCADPQGNVQRGVDRSPVRCDRSH